MAATPIGASNRYIRAGVSKVVLTDTVASASLDATRSEINAGTEVAGEINSVTGFTKESQSQEVPDWGSRLNKKIPARISLADASITFYADEAGADIRDVVAQDDETYVIFMDGGDVTGSPMEVFKCTVASVSTSKDDGGGAVMVNVSFTIEDASDLLTVPA